MDIIIGAIAIIALLLFIYLFYVLFRGEKL